MADVSSGLSLTPPKEKPKKSTIMLEVSEPNYGTAFESEVNQTSNNTTSSRKELCLQKANLVQGQFLFTETAMGQTQIVASSDKLLENNKLERIWKEPSRSN
jgi:hypothetical protein